MDKQGLYAKYTIINNETGIEVDECFVLKPRKDYHALGALHFYADSVRDDNPQLADELMAWLDDIQEHTD